MGIPFFVYSINNRIPADEVSGIYHRQHVQGHTFCSGVEQTCS